MVAVRAGWSKALPLLIVSVCLIAGLVFWQYQRRAQHRAEVISQVHSELSVLEDLRSEMVTAYEKRLNLLKSWIGDKKFAQYRFPVPKQIKTQDDFGVFDQVQNQVSQVLSEALGAGDPKRMEQLMRLEEGINQTRAKYHLKSFALIKKISDEGMNVSPPPVSEAERAIQKLGE